MKVDTLRFGELEIAAESIITLPEGLVGMNEVKRFCLIDASPQSPLNWLQAIDEPGLAFVVSDPFAFCPDYELEVKEEEVAALGITNPEEVVVLVLLTINAKNQEVTANLVAPIVICAKTRKAKQVILQDMKYTTKHPLVPAAVLEPGMLAGTLPNTGQANVSTYAQSG